MKVLIASAPTELEEHVALAGRVVRSLDWEHQAHDPSAVRSVEAGLVAVGRSDLVLGLVGWRRGPLPGPIVGWDGETPWVAYELRRAFALHKPVLVMLADESWPEREEDPRSRALMADWRAELEPLAVPFTPGIDPGHGDFQALLETELSRFRDRGLRARGARRLESRSTLPEPTLRTWPPPPYPPEPWPLLLPYSHPDLLAGRERDLQELLGELARPQVILGLHALSGTGKTSLLAGGLVPRLRAAGRPVAYDRHPAEPGIAGRLIDDLLDGSPPDPDLDRGSNRESHLAFLDRLLLASRLAGEPPLLVLDQVEELLRGDRLGRAELGPLLAVTVQQRPEIDGPPCRWLLAYRREAHGELVRWLSDVLREARALGFGMAEGTSAVGLPHDLAGHERFHAWPLAALGAPSSRDADPEAAASAAFRAVLKTPLALVDEEGNQRYPLCFAKSGAERLARAFVAERLADREAPLVPELQVILAHLTAEAGPPRGGNPATLVIPDDLSALMDSALEKHLAQALDAAFPTATQNPTDRNRRTRALLALHQLAGAQGRRTEGRTSDALIRAIGRQGREVLEKLQAPGVRLVVARSVSDEGTVYLLAHDRLAAVIVAAVEGEGHLALDRELLDLARFVALRSELFHDGERQSSTEITPAQMAAIERQGDCLLIDHERLQWWSACRERRRRAIERRLTIGLALTAWIALLAWLLGSHFTSRASRETLLDRIAQGRSEAAFAALETALSEEDISPAEIRESLAERASPLDVLEAGMGGVPEPRRSRLVLALAELALPLVASAGPEDPVALASLLWALDYGPGRNPDLASRARELRNAALAPLRERQPPPPVDAEAPGWVRVPAGSFRMGTEAEGAGEEDEGPARDVTVLGFRILDHEVTNAEYRRLALSHPGPGDLPANFVTWYQAYLYAAWLGGRLPSEAEWEYAARAGCAYTHCLADGREASVDQVAWTVGTSRGPELGEPGLQPGRRLAPNPWGLYDVFGNLWEWTGDWYGPYEAGNRMDPRGPTGGRRRVSRGSGFTRPAITARPALRFGFDPTSASGVRGFRPVLPEVSNASSSPP